MLVDSAPGTPVENSVSVIGGARGSAGGTVTCKSLYCCTLMLTGSCLAACLWLSYFLVM